MMMILCMLVMGEATTMLEWGVGLSPEAWIFHLATITLALLAVLLLMGQRRDIRRTHHLNLAETQLQQTGGLLMAMLQATPLAVIRSDLEGRVEFWNEAAERLFGWKACDIIGQPLPYIPVEGREESDMLSARVTAGESFAEFDVRLMRRDGTPIDVRLSAAPVRNAAGEIQAILNMLLDVTEAKRIEREHQAVQGQFRQSQKLETVGRLAGGVAHDFNNLLQVIQGNAEIAQRCVPDGASILGEAIQEILTSGHRASQLTQQLLAFSRRQGFRPVTLDLNAVVGDLENMLKRMLGEDITVGTQYDPELKPILADSGQIGQVLLNLAVNARDAMPRGGCFSLHTGPCRVQAQPGNERPLPDMPPGLYSMLSVADTGCGMDETVKAHLYEPFFTTKEPDKGTGLGLATIYGIVKQSGGHIRIDSEIGVGTTCKLYFPVAEAGAVVAAADAETAPPLSLGGTETILLVEDADSIRRMAATSLRELGYRILVAENGAAALRLSAQHEGPLHLLLTDIVMPGINGCDLAQRLLRQRPELRVLYMSGYAETIRAEHRQAIADNLLMIKPFPLSQLAQRIRSLLDGASA